MNTPAHLIFGAAAFGDPRRPRVTVAAIAGALLPDLSLYVMVGVSIWGFGISPHEVFGRLYYSDAWQQVFAIDNSFVLWAALLVIALYLKRPAMIAFTGAALLHLAFDFPLHHGDARMHFWPLSTWVFESPLSYWDRSHFGQIIGPLEIAVSIGLIVSLMIRFRRWRERGLFCLLALAEIMASGIWRYIF